MTLDRQDIEAIAREVARLLLPALQGQAPPPPPIEEVPVMPGSFRERAQAAIAKASANEERRSRRGRS